jgi:hypothetical protein
MSIYKILRDSESFMEFATDQEEMLDEIGPHTGELEFMHFSRNNLKLEPYWKNFQGTFKKVRNGATKIPDITCWRGATLVVSQTAYNKLKDSLTPYGEFLPITCDDAPYFIFNCLELAKLDSSNSIFNTEDGHQIEAQKIVFDNSTESKTVFKSQDEGCTAVFCSETLKNKVQSENLKGIKFSENLATIF